VVEEVVVVVVEVWWWSWSFFNIHRWSSNCRFIVLISTPQASVARLRGDPPAAEMSAVVDLLVAVGLLHLARAQLSPEILSLRQEAGTPSAAPPPEQRTMTSICLSFIVIDDKMDGR